MGANPTAAAATAARIMAPTMANGMRDGAQSQQPQFAMPGAKPAYSAPPPPQAGAPAGYSMQAVTGSDPYTTYEPPPEFTQQLADRYRVSPAQAKVIYNQLMQQKGSGTGR